MFLACFSCTYAKRKSLNLLARSLSLEDFRLCEVPCRRDGIGLSMLVVRGALGKNSYKRDDTEESVAIHEQASVIQITTRELT